MNILFALVIISAVVGIHEFGHLLAYRMRGVPVLAFSFGFGPVLLRRRIGETEYRLSLLPFGGYVIPASEDALSRLSDDELQHLELRHPRLFEERRWLDNSSPLTRFVGALGGPAANFAAAFLIGVAAFASVDQIVDPSPALIDEIEAGSLAETAGVRAGDEIVQIDGFETSNRGLLSALLQRGLSKGRFTIEVLREGTRLTIPVSAPRATEGANETGIRFGAALSPEKMLQNPGIVEAAGASAQNLVSTAKLNLVFIRGLFGGESSLRELSGPVGVVAATTEVLSRGFFSMIMMIIFLNIGLGFFNLIPVPVLDGGHMLLASIEGVTQRRIPDRVKIALTAASVVLLFGLIAFTLVNDIWQLAS